MRRKRNRIVALLLSAVLCFGEALPVLAMEKAELPETVENLEMVTEKKFLEEDEATADEATDAGKELPDESPEPAEVELTETPEGEQKTIQIGETFTLEGEGPWIFYFTPEEDGDYFLYEIESKKVIFGDCYRLSDNKFISESLDMYPLTASETYYIEVGAWGGSQGDSLQIAKRIDNEIKIGESVRLEGPAPNWRYYFTPTEDGNYTYEYVGTVEICWYRVHAEDKLQRMGYDNAYDLVAGTEYCIMVDSYESSRNSIFKIVKNQKYEITPGDSINLGEIYAGRYYYFTSAESGVYCFESDSAELDVVDAAWHKVSNGVRTRLSSVGGFCELEAETEYCVRFESGMEGHSVRLVMNEEFSPIRRMVPGQSEEIAAGESRYFRLDLDPEKTYYLGVPSNWYDSEKEEWSNWKYSEYLSDWNSIIHGGVCWFLLKNDAPTYLLITSAPENVTIYLTESLSSSETIEDWSGSLTFLAGEQKYLTLTGKTTPGDYLISLNNQADYNVISEKDFSHEDAVLGEEDYLILSDKALEETAAFSLENTGQNSQVEWDTISEKDFSHEKATIKGQDYLILSDKGLGGNITVYLKNTGAEKVTLSLHRDTEFEPTVVTAGTEYNNPSRYLSFTPPNTGFYKIAQRQYALRWIYKKSDNSVIKYAPGDEYIFLEGGAEYLLCWSGDVFSIIEEKPDIVEVSGKALEMEAGTYYAFTPTETGVYVADPNPNKVTCWCGCEEGKWTRDKDTGHYGHQMEAGKTYYIKPVSYDVRISLKRNVTILDYDYYNAFVASGGAVSVDGTITEGNAGWSLKFVAYALFDFIRDGITDLSKFARGNQYWKTDDEGAFKADTYYSLKDPKTPIQPDDIKDKEVLLVEYRPQIVWVQSIALEAGKTSLAPGESIQVEAKLDKGQDKYDFIAEPVLRWESSDDAVATVDENGKVTANQVGNATITVYADEALRQQEGLNDIVKASIEFSVGPDTTSCTITFDLQGKGTVLPEYAEYTGIKKGSTIKQPTDPEAAGYAFTGWYKEAACQNLWDFEKDIVEADITLYAGWISEMDYEGVFPGDTLAVGRRDGFWVAAIKDQTYTGKAIKPNVHVYSQNQRLREGWDYTLTYKNNIKVSKTKTPQVIVKGKGNYTGTYKVNFKIVETGLNENHLVYVPVYPKGKAYTPVMIKDGILLKANTDYTITYENNDTHAVTKKAPAKVGSYTIHVKGKGSCEGEFSVPCTVTDIDGTTSITKVRASIPAMTYKGDMPNPVLRIKGNILKEGTDYKVLYANTNVKGTATAIFIGQGAYTGILKKTFKVKAASIASIPSENIVVSESAVYKKGGAKPEISVTMDGVKLTMGVDYTVSYKNNKRIGKTATVTIKGKGNYNKKVSKNFLVVAE